MLQRGAYRDLLDEAYASERPLPREHELLYRICGARGVEEEQAVREMADKFFPLVADERFHKRVASETGKAQVAIAKQVAAAEATNRAKEAARSTERYTERSTARSTDTSSIHQPPSSKNQPPAVKPPTEGQTPSAAPREKPRRAAPEERTALQEACSATWTAYRIGYERRWQAPPLRDKTANAMIKTFCQKLPHEEAPLVAEFYTQHHRGLYVSAHHALQLMVRDAHAIRTEWFTSKPQTDSQARAADRVAGTGNVFRELIDEAAEREALTHAN